MRTASVVLAKVSDLRVMLPPVVTMLMISGWLKLTNSPAYENAALKRLVPIIYDLSVGFLDVYGLLLLGAGSVVLIGQFKRDRAEASASTDRTPVSETIGQRVVQGTPKRAKENGSANSTCS